MSSNRLNDLLTVANAGIDWMAKAKDAEAKLADLTALHHASEWTEADGPVFWWAMRNGEWIFCEKATMYFNAQKNNGWHWSRIPKVVLL